MGKLIEIKTNIYQGGHTMEGIRVRREYRVTARFAGDTKRHVVGGKPSQSLTLEEAQELANSVMANSDYEMKHHKSLPMEAGSLLVETEFNPDYIQVDVQIQYRDITPWKTIG